MPSEILLPDTLIAANNFGSCALADLVARDSSFCVAANNNTNTDVHVGFPAPSGNLTPGAGMQIIAAEVRRFDNGQSGNPDARIEVWESGGGSPLVVGTEIAVGGNDPIILQLWFDASVLADISGTDLEVKVFGLKSGGSPSNRNTVDIGEIRWTADYVESGPDVVMAAFGQ